MATMAESQNKYIRLTIVRMTKIDNHNNIINFNNGSNLIKYVITNIENVT